MTEPENIAQAEKNPRMILAEKMRMQFLYHETASGDKREKANKTAISKFWYN